jgi:large subunit ribosomal protein L10
MLLKRSDKEQLITEMSEKFQTAKTVVLVNYQGLKVKEVQKLKKNLLETGIKLQIVKNSLFKIALKEQGIEAPAEVLDQPVATIWGLDDEIAPAKSIVAFGKELEKLEIIGAIVNGKFVDAATVKQLADIPSRPELYAKLLGTLNAPMSGLVNVLQGNLRSLVYILDQYSKTKVFDKVEMVDNSNSVQKDEKDSEQAAEVEAKLDFNASKEENSNPDEVAQQSAAVEEAMGADVEMPAEVMAINTDNDTALEASESVK